MNKINLIITGIRYTRSDFKEVLSCMKGTKEIMNILVEESTQFGPVLLCFHKNEKLGVVSRLDIPRAQQAMRQLGCKVMKCDLVDVYPEFGFLTVGVELDDELSAETSAPRADWSQWQWRDPAMECTRAEKDAQADATLLEYYLTASMPRTESARTNFVQTIVGAIGKVIRGLRYGVSWESQQTSMRIRDLVAMHEDEEVRAMLPQLLKAINDLGSDDRIDDFLWNEWPKIRESDESQAMQEKWRKQYGVTSELNEANYTIMKQWLQDTDHLLQEPVVNDLPLGMGDEGRLFHLLIYRGIPMQKWLELRSFMILRHHIEALTRLYEIRLAQPELAEPEPVYNRPRGEETPADPSREVLSKYIRRKEWLDDAVYNISHATDDREVAEWVRKMNKEGKINLDRRKEALLRDLKALGICHMGRSRWFEYLS